MLKPDALNRWLDRLGSVRTLTSAADAWLKGYDQAVESVFAEPEETKVREGLLLSLNYGDMRGVLDEAEDDLFMTRPMAQFYLAMSPKLFKQALESGPHPFAEPKGGATKGAIDAWFLKRTTAGKNTGGRTFKRVRSLDTGRFYLVSEDGVILGDAAINRMDPEGVVRHIAKGAKVRRMKLATALAMPWADPVARKPWAHARQALLEEQLEEAQAKVARTRVALAQAKAQDMEATFPPATTRTRGDPFRF